MPDSRAHVEEHSRYTPPEPGQRSRRRRSRLSRRLPGELDNRSRRLNFLTAVGLTGLVLVYSLVLLLAILRRPSPEPTPPPLSSTQETAVPESASPPSRLETIQARIQGWENAVGALRESNRLLYHKNLLKAEQTLGQALQSSPSNLELLLAQAEVATDLKHYDLAADLLINVLDVDPGRSDARVKLATALYGVRDFEATLAVTDWVLKQEAYSSEAHNLAANAYLSLDQPTAAIPHLRRLRLLDPGNTAAQNNLAVAYTRMGNYQEAEKVLLDILNTEPENSIAYFNLAACYALQNRPEKVVEIFERAAIKFGDVFVKTWLESKDFDAVRNDPRIAALLDQLRRTPQAVAVSTNAPSELEAGAAPAPHP